jgi:hypothetical protein
MRFGYGKHVRPTLLWTLLIAKSRRLESGFKPKLFAGMFADPRRLSLTTTPNSSVLVWQSCQTHTSGSGNHDRFKALDSDNHTRFKVSGCDNHIRHKMGESDNHGSYARPKRLGLATPYDIYNKTIWKWQKHQYMQPCFSWNPRVILYLNYFNKREGQRSSSTHAYCSPLQGHDYIFTVDLFWKDKRRLQPKS